MSAHNISVKTNCITRGLHLRQRLADGVLPDGTKFQIDHVFAGAILVTIGAAQYEVGLRDIMDGVLALHETKPELEDHGTDEWRASRMGPSKAEPAPGPARTKKVRKTK